MAKAKSARKNQEKQRQIDPVFKQALTDELANLPAVLQTEVEVSRLPRTIDAIVTVDGEGALQTVRTNTPFFYFLYHNQVEFKGRRDPLTVQGYHLIRGRTHLYIGEQETPPEEMVVTIVCAGKPKTVFTYAEQLKQPFVPVEAGYYRRQGQPPIYLIVINELPITPKNYGLLLFAASKRKFREFLEEVVAQQNMVYIRYAYEVEPKLTREVLTMAGISSTLSKSDLKFMAEDIGRELLAFLPVEDRLAGLKAEELLDALAPEERNRLFAGLKAEELLKALPAKERKRLFELMVKMNSATQKTEGKSSNN
ncbi:MAG: hypothetical protein DYG89_32975 [Caldilinea sp. CFX5]|nr:hypothetical protein [Caldilinea sp. CFX5]